MSTTADTPVKHANLLSLLDGNGRLNAAPEPGTLQQHLQKAFSCTLGEFSSTVYLNVGVIYGSEMAPGMETTLPVCVVRSYETNNQASVDSLAENLTAEIDGWGQSYPVSPVKTEFKLNISVYAGEEERKNLLLFVPEIYIAIDNITAGLTIFKPE